MNNYKDIINLTRPQSKHPHLGIDSRAAQFAPFAALTGYDSAVKSVYEYFRDDEYEGISACAPDISNPLEIINNKLNYIEKNIKEKSIISVTYFVKDEKKDGGRYESYSGIVKRINNVEEYIKFEDNKIINFNDILSLDGEIFNSFSIYE